MRSVKFRDVLWAVARKAGFSPESGNFLTNQALAIGEYINEWVDRLYSAEDWPEWTKLVEAGVGSTHVVPYDLSGATGSTVPAVRIGRVINVYLVDPRTTSAPVSTDFALTELGIHCGFDHGQTVWIEYIEPAPEFTAEVWDSNRSYSAGDTVYSSRTGECYKSKVNHNLGHDPSSALSPPPGDQQQARLPIQTDLIQQASAPVLGTTGQPKIIEIDISQSDSGTYDVPNPPAISALFQIPVLDQNSTVLAIAQHVCVTGIETLAVIGTDLRNQLVGSLGAAWTITFNATTFKLRLQNNSNFLVLNQIGGGDAPKFYPTSAGKAKILDNVQIQPFIAADSFIQITQQIIKTTISGDQIIPGASYSFTFYDSSGAPHPVSYTSMETDAVGDVYTGLANAIQAAGAGDSFIAGIGTTIDAGGSSLSFSGTGEFSVNALLVPQGSPWWDKLPFPAALFEQVIRGASADLLKEWGQEDKGLAEESLVPQETATSRGDFETTPTAPLTSQEKPFSRYRIQQ